VAPEGDDYVMDVSSVDLRLADEGQTHSLRDALYDDIPYIPAARQLRYVTLGFDVYSRLYQLPTSGDLILLYIMLFL